MALREKLGRLVLLEETDASPLGREFRAARLGPAGLDRLVTVLCFAPGVSAQANATKRLMDEARLAARLQNPGLVRVLGIGRVEQTFYVSTELIEGRTLASVFERCQRESFPFAGDHALMVASRVASALEYLHGKKDDSAQKLFHGLLAPSRVVVSYDGEVKVKGLGLWPALRESDMLGAEDRVYLAPEQAAGGPGDPRSDVYALGLLLLQALTGRGPDGGDPRAALAEAKVVSVSGESSPLPKLLFDLLQRALGDDPAGRYPSMAEMRKAIDTLLFSGDFTPTTFDLAFFMHTLFREDMDREARAIEEARRADYREFLDEKAGLTTDPGLKVGTSAPPVAALPAPPMPPAPSLPPASAIPEAPAMAEAQPSVEPARPAAVPDLPAPKPVVAEPALAPKPAPVEVRPAPSHEPPPRTVHADSSLLSAPLPAAPDHHVPAHEPAHDPHDHHGREAGRIAREGSAREPSMRLTLGATPAKPARGRGFFLGIGAAVIVALVAVGGFLYMRSRAAAPPPTPPPPSAEALAAMARVKELETRLADFERQRQEAEAKAAAEAQRKIEAQAAARGRQVDPAESQRVQEEASRRARAEEEARQQQELRRLAEAKRAADAQVAAAAAAAAAATPTPTAPPATNPPAETASVAAPPTTAPAAPETPPAPTSTPTQPGSIVSVNDPKLIPPFMLSGDPAVYPPLARQHGIEGTVELSALVDENGRVAEVSIVRARPRNVGFESAAVAAVRSRRYRAGTREGVPVRVWIPIVVNFKGRR